MQQVVVQLQMQVIVLDGKRLRSIWTVGCMQRQFFGILERVKSMYLSFNFGIYGDTKVVILWNQRPRWVFPLGAHYP